MAVEQLIPHSTPGAQISTIDGTHRRLAIPASETPTYRLAQLDDCGSRRRHDFPWQAPVSFSLQARASRVEIPGTWGFGLWNDPFSMKIGFGGSHLLPALPNAAWFFFASPPNYLSFRNDHPADGALAAVFRSPHIPTWVFAPALIGLPLLLVPPAARLARRLAGRIIREDGTRLELDPTEWHHYRLDWRTNGVDFYLDHQLAFTIPLSPRGPLGFILWIDTQYAAWTPDGRLKYGSLPSDSNWIEVKDLGIQSGIPEGDNDG
jgi:hypothetical protein